MSTIRILTAVVLSLVAPGCTTGCATDTAEPIDLPIEEPVMAAFTFTADAGTDQLTIAGHGLNTGDGPAAVRNIGGTLPAATPALGPVLDRFVIRVDANHIKLAASSSDAHAGIAIDITSAGTGTHVLEIGVPFRRPRTYAPGVQLRSEDLNAIFDTWAALHALLTAQSQSVWTGVTLAGNLSVGGNISVGGALKRGPRTILVPLRPAASPGFSDASVTINPATNAFTIGLPLFAGERIVAVRAGIVDSLVGPTRLVLKLKSTTLFSSTTLSTLATSSQSSGGGGAQTLTLSGLTLNVVSGDIFYAHIEPSTGSASCTILTVEVDTDVP